MKNIEKYKDILFNICVKDQDHFMVTKDGDICTCVWNKADCKNCKLYKKFISCKELRLNWLNEDFIPTFYIDKADKAFLLNALTEGYNYFCRVYNAGGIYHLIASKSKPDVKEGKLHNNISYVDLTPFKIKLPFIGSSDHSEVWTLEEILNLPERERYNHEDA